MPRLPHNPSGRNSGTTASLWTLSGLVLVACGGGGGGGSGFASRPIVSSEYVRWAPVTVLDGPVEGARVRVDTDGNGSFDYRAPGVTNALGQIDVPENYLNYPMRADVDGATDTQTGRPLSGSWLSLITQDSTNIITPITDFVTRTRTTQESPGSVMEILDDIVGGDRSFNISDEREYILNSSTADGVFAHLSIALSTGASRDEAIVLFAPYRAKPDRSTFDAMTDLADGALKTAVMEAISAAQSRPVIVDPVNPVGSQNRPIKIENPEAFFGFRDPLGQETAEAGMAGVYIQPASTAIDGDMVQVYLGDTMLSMASATERGDGQDIPDIPDYIYVATAMIPDLEFRAGPDVTGTGFGISFYVHDGEDTSEDPATITVDILPPPSVVYTPEPFGRISNTVDDWQRIGQFTIAGANESYGFADFEVGDFLIGASMPDEDGEFTAASAPGTTFRLRKNEQAERFILEVNLNPAASGSYVLDGVRVVDDTYTSNMIDGIAFSVTGNVLAYENHPLHKPAHDFDSPVAEGAWSLPAADENTVNDNRSFRIDNDGRVWWLAAPDFESPGDSDENNIYDINAVFTTDDGAATGHDISIQVQDIAAEITPRHLPQGGTFIPGVHGSETFARGNILEDDMPADYVQHLIWGYVWEMPKIGPLVLTWSLILGAAVAGIPRDYSYSSESVIRTQENIDHAREQITDALDAYEEVSNIEFIETGHTATGTGHIHFEFINDQETNIEGQAHQPLFGAEVTINFRGDPLDDNMRDWVIIHETGHALGLAHPFLEDKRGWPGRPEYEEGAGSELSVMSYHEGHAANGNDALRAADIAALEFLYGRKGSNFEGVEALLVRAERSVESSIETAALIIEDDLTDATAATEMV